MANVYFITQGCSANLADSEIMQGVLQENGYSIVKEIEKSDAIVYNTCSVKTPSETTFKKRLGKIESKYPNKRVIIAGCIPQAQRYHDNLKGHSLIGTYQIGKITEVVEKTLNGDIAVNLQRENKPRLNLPKIKNNQFIEIVPILQGCLSGCAFCKTKHARGNLYSYGSKDIVLHISNAVKHDAKEIWLTSQDNSVYGVDINTNMSQLLSQITSIPGNFKVRVGMSNPRHILPMLKDLIESFRHNKIYRFLHIPLQSGSNSVLRTMKRGYTVEEYAYIIDSFKKKLPQITVATDIICGFPTETEEDFNKTIEAIKQTKPDIINISRFWPRPGTLAAKMQQVCGREIKKRTRYLTNLFHEIAEENNKRWVGWEGRILITEKGKEKSYIGRNHAYKQVIVNSSRDLLGEEISVKVISATAFDLRAEISQ